MQIQIVGDGTFGSFLRDLFKDSLFDVVDQAESVVLAVPHSAYDECGLCFKDRHLINVCSVQEDTTEILLTYTPHVTSLHPLFGRRTPKEKRFLILTHCCDSAAEQTFLKCFADLSKINQQYTPAGHDRLMAKTHRTAFEAADLARPLIERAVDVPDFLIPHSFRLLREFVQTLDDMPAGTVESIMANPYR